MERRNWILLIVFAVATCVIALDTNQEEGYLDEFRSSIYEELSPVDTVKTSISRW